MYAFPDPAADDGPYKILERIMSTHDEHAELGAMVDAGITVAFLLQGGPMKLGGRSILGFCCMPAVQGVLRPLFEQLLEDALGYYPDFMIVLSADWWEDASQRQREILVSHEARHAGHAKDDFGSPKFNKQTGLPVCAMVPHDIEEFNSIVKRYGSWTPDIAAFLEAADLHAPADESSSKKTAEARF